MTKDKPELLLLMKELQSTSDTGGHHILGLYDVRLLIRTLKAICAQPESTGWVPIEGLDKALRWLDRYIAEEFEEGRLNPEGCLLPLRRAARRYAEINPNPRKENE